MKLKHEDIAREEECMMKQLAAALFALAITGCASELHVWDANNTSLKGVPFRAAELYKVQGIYKMHSELGTACTPAPFERTTALPTGAQYFANIQPAQLSKSEFSMTFADSGTLASISMNSEPAAADTINAATSALSTLLPFAGVTPKPQASQPAAAPAATPSISSAPACDAGPEEIKYIKFRADG